MARCAALVPFFVFAIGLGVVTLLMEMHHVGATGEGFALTPLERVLIAGRALLFYVGKLAWPYPLAFWYPRWDVNEHVWWQYLYPAAALAAIVALWLRGTGLAVHLWQRY